MPSSVYITLVKYTSSGSHRVHIVTTGSDMVKIKLICIVISLISIQFVTTQSYEYEEDEYKENEYINYPTFGLRESTVVKLNHSRNHSKRTEAPVEYTTSRRAFTRRTTSYLKTTESTQRVPIIPTSSPRSKLHEPGRISIQLGKNDFVFANEIEQTKNFTTSEEVQQRFKELNFDDAASDKSESPSRFIETTYKIDHSPYGNTGYNKHITNHNFDSKNLFSTDVTAKKTQNSNGSGYFKSNWKYDLNKLSNNHNHFPIHEKLKTDLAVVDLPLHSFPRPLKNFKNQHLPIHHSIEELTTKSAASNEQIKSYNDDVKKYYDRLLEEQLRTSKDPADKAKYHQFIKAMEDEKIEQQSPSIRDLKRQRPIKSGRPRPFISHDTRTKSPEKTFGLSYFKFGVSSSSSERPYKFPFL